MIPMLSPNRNDLTPKAATLQMKNRTRWMSLTLGSLFATSSLLRATPIRTIKKITKHIRISGVAAAPGLPRSPVVSTAIAKTNSMQNPAPLINEASRIKLFCHVKVESPSVILLVRL